MKPTITITISGPKGAGKTTILTVITFYLKKRGFNVVAKDDSILQSLDTMLKRESHFEEVDTRLVEISTAESQEDQPIERQEVTSVNSSERESLIHKAMFAGERLNILLSQAANLVTFAGNMDRDVKVAIAKWGEAVENFYNFHTNRRS